LDKNSDVVKAFTTIEITHMDEHKSDNLMEQIIHMNFIHVWPYQYWGCDGNIWQIGLNEWLALNAPNEIDNMQNFDHTWLNNKIYVN
jgi:hypothetical protein